MTMPCQLPRMFDPNQNQILGAAAFIKVSGKYPVIITDAQMKAVAGNNAAHYLQFTLEITDGELRGQSFVDRLNLVNSNPKTVEMAVKSLTSYATAIGQQQAFDDANILRGRPFQLYVEAVEEPSTTDPNKSQWANSVKRWYYADGNEVQQGKYGSLTAQGTAPNGQQPQGGYAPPAGAPAAPQGYAPPAQQQPPQQQVQHQQQPVQQQAPQGYAPPQGYADPNQQQQVQQQQQQAPQGYAPPAQQQQQQPAQQQAPAGQVTIQTGYAPPQGNAPAGYVPPAAPNFAAPSN